jgi:CheY-like chemotaxis protein
MSIKCRVLVVEDSAPISRILGLLLEGAGYGVVLADDGQAARRARTGAAPPEVVVLDLSLPDVDGRTLLAEFAAASLPVVVVSAFASTLTADERALAAAVISKPFDVEELLRAVARAGPDGE